MVSDFLMIASVSCTSAFALLWSRREVLICSTNRLYSLKKNYVPITVRQRTSILRRTMQALVWLVEVRVEMGVYQLL